MELITICYTNVIRKGMVHLDGQTADLYRQPDIEKYEDLHLLDLSESCAMLEDRVHTIAQSLPDRQRQVIEAYISTRNDLEVETVKTALRWGKQHYK